MPPRRPQSIGGMPFTKQIEAKLFIRELLNEQTLEEVIQEPHHSFLCDLVSRHPQAAEKIGVGIKHFTVGPSKGGTRCFYVNRVDGTRDAFSTKKCFPRDI